ncbi:MAG TPA: polysaccharide biosynthesis/export family protein [Pyrinomonadaceae bacterium]|nr:polysaccharide biosynthesis/export family protein [Pyrinomonadaceae bacterium]
MKHRIIATALLLIVPTILSAQTPTKQTSANDRNQSTASDAGAMRDRVVRPRVSNQVDPQKTGSDAKADPGTSGPNPEPGPPAWGNTAFIARPSAVDRNASTKTTPETSPVAPGAQTVAAKKLIQPTSLVGSPVRTEGANPRVLSAARTPAMSTYNVGIGDVLDVRVANMPTRESTLFTVLGNGTLEYPLLNGPVPVAGLSPDEIARVLSSEIKVIKAPRITVTVRDYASHAFVIGGLVDSPGRKILRREAMPLFAVLAEALIRPEATAATILRNGKEGDLLALKDEQAMATLILPGDVIKISGAPLAPRKFLYVGGEVSSPGEKAFREGMTLTQALLSAGGAAPAGKTIRIARRNASGFLSTNEYNLRAIEAGKTQDPFLEAGDRIEVTRGL